MKTITLPNRISDNFGSAITEIFKLIKEISTIDIEENIHIDYSKVDFTHPFFTLPLLLLLKNKKKEGYNIDLSTNFVKASVQSYMDNIFYPDILACEEKSAEEITDILNRYRNKNYIPLISFPIGTDLTTIEIRDRFISHLNNLIFDIIKTTEQPQLKTAISYMTDELLSNIVHHAAEDNGYILAQNYPTKGYIDICIADIGRTLLQSYETFENNKHQVENHKNALKAALSGKSTKGQIDRGYGISTSTKMLCEGLNGSFFMFSGNSFASINAQQKDIIEIEIPGISWQGVLIFLRIPSIIPANFNYINYLE